MNRIEAIKELSNKRYLETLGKRFKFTGKPEIDFPKSSKGPFQRGNKKLSEKYCLTLSTVPVATCPMYAVCGTACYSLAAWCAYDDTRRSWARNTWYLLFRPETFRELVENQLRKDGRPVVRINNDGDMPNQATIDFWAGVISRFPHKKFYIYTKTRGIFDWSAMESLPNVSLIDSLPGGKCNFGAADYVEALAKKTGGTICTKCVEFKGNQVCGDPSRCVECMTGSGWKNMLFVVH